MIRTFLAALFVVAPAFAADDAILDEVETAKAAHAKELRILRQHLLDDIDKVIRQTDDTGGGIDDMLRERTGFAENGVTFDRRQRPGQRPARRQRKRRADRRQRGRLGHGRRG